MLFFIIIVIVIRKGTRKLSYVKIHVLIDGYFLNILQTEMNIFLISTSDQHIFLHILSWLTDLHSVRYDKIR